MSAPEHPRRVADTADLVLWATLMKPPTLGQGRLICVDGPAGSGKSTLGEALVALGAGSGSVALVHLDDLLDGWEGLPTVAETLERDVLRPVRAGLRGGYRRYDWHKAAFGDQVLVDPVDLLVVEGVGSGATSYCSWITTLVWVDAPDDLRLARGMARDGESLRPQWLRWMAAETQHLARERTKERADFVVDGTGEADVAVIVR